MKALLAFFVLLAGVSTSQAGMLGDFQTFTPNTDGLYFINAHSGQVLKKGTWTANTYLSYAKNYLLAYDSITTQNRVNYKDELIEWDGTFGYSFTSSLQGFLAVSGLINQKPDASEVNQVYMSKGVHTYRPGLKWNFSSSKDSLWALVGSVDILNVSNDPYTGLNPGPIPNLELVWSGLLGGKATHGFNLGYRNRNPGETPTDATFYPLKSQMTMSYGYSYPWSSATRLVFETIGCYPIDKGGNKSASDVSCLEFLGAARYRISRNFASVVGATVEAPGMQTMSPAWRVFVGLNAYLFPNSQEQRPAKAREVAPLNVPAQLTMKPSEALPLPISGGSAPYTCEMIEGNRDDSHLDNCVFTAPAYADTVIINVKDASGQTKNVEITVAPDESALSLSPKEANLVQGQTLTFTASGGKYPLRYILASGPGSIDEVTGRYRASGEPGIADIRVIDGQGREDSARVEVRQAARADKTLTLKDVNFVFNTTDLIPSSQARLDRAIEAMRGLRIREIIVQGHTDDVGNEEYNRQLSERRAQRIAEILQNALNLRADQFRAIGFGEDKPLVKNVDDHSRQQNRRVELLIYTAK